MITSIAAFPDIWVLRTHAPGDNDQSLALAEALGAPFAVIPVDWPAADPDEDRVTLRDFLAKGDEAAARRIAAGLRAPWPRRCPHLWGKNPGARLNRRLACG